MTSRCSAPRRTLRRLGAAVLLGLCAAGPALAAGSGDERAPAAPALPQGAPNAVPDAAPRTPPATPLARRARACTVCHGDQGRAAADGYQPRIAGKPAGYLFEQLVAFRDGRRHYGPMTELLQPLDDAFLRALAGHFAALELPYPPPSASALDAAAAERARQLVVRGDGQRQLPACAACHGERLTGVLPAVPSLLGLPRDYLLAQLGGWRTGKRHARAPDCMAEVARRLEPAEVVLLSAWLSSQPMPEPVQPAAALPAKMPLHCGSQP